MGQALYIIHYNQCKKIMVEIPKKLKTIHRAELSRVFEKFPSSD
ncbi:hypothetical protein ACO2KE_19435 [Leptospira interrogans]